MMKVLWGISIFLHIFSCIYQANIFIHTFGTEPKTRTHRLTNKYIQTLKKIFLFLNFILAFLGPWEYACILSILIHYTHPHVHSYTTSSLLNITSTSVPDNSPLLGKENNSEALICLLYLILHHSTISSFSARRNNQCLSLIPQVGLHGWV